MRRPSRQTHCGDVVHADINDAPLEPLGSPAGSIRWKVDVGASERIWLCNLHAVKPPLQVKSYETLVDSNTKVDVNTGIVAGVGCSR